MVSNRTMSEETFTDMTKFETIVTIIQDSKHGPFLNLNYVIENIIPYSKERVKTSLRLKK